MIKLNNKNITYVALADSNNSLKAPKEIWYADSSNSVKLVYRRKDALIEGEDYEKYHWLQGRNGAYIDTMHPLTTYDDAFYVKAHFDGIVRNPEGQEQDLFGYKNNLQQVDIVAYINNQGNYNAVYTKAGASVNGINIPATNIESYVSANGSDYTKTLNGTPYTYSNADLPQGTFGNVYLFTRNGYTSRYFHGDIASFRISDPTFTTDKMNLIPCKLLKPVPKWLDANGIRRQVGECGMIDLVSGKFYGNVNSVGTFTVENYYERKEWLVGDYVAYIDTNVIVNVATLLISTKINRSNSTANFFIFGSRDIARSDDPSTSSVVVSPQSFRCDIIDGNNIFDSSSIASIELSFPTLTINGQSLTTQRVPTTSQNTFRIFTTSVVNSGTYCFNGGISGFVLNDGSNSLDLIPCTLTMDLPASMDANNIARTKGTSGMWDLVSDRFYGNVADSGTFKAVNLAEGVDYEVHDWLVGDDTARIVKNFNFWQNKLEVEVGGEQGNQFATNYNETGVYVAAVYNNGGGNPYMLVSFRETTSGHIGDVLYSQFPERLSMVFYIQDGIAYCNQNGTLHTGQQLTESIWNKDIPLYIPAKEMSYIREVLPNDTYRSNLIPVKLLRSIPSKYDANGIARQVGECGMYDTVNDVFYGNVASSGTFSVSDDN